VWSFIFFIRATTANDHRLRRIFYPIYVPILILEKEQVFPFLMLSAAKRGYYFLQRLWYDAVLDWGLNPRPPALYH